MSDLHPSLGLQLLPKTLARLWSQGVTMKDGRAQHPEGGTSGKSRASLLPVSSFGAVLPFQPGFQQGTRMSELIAPVQPYKKSSFPFCLPLSFLCSFVQLLLLCEDMGLGTMSLRTTAGRGGGFLYGL